MKQLTCEMCGGTDLIKQDGVFVCQTCGTKYSVEEAKKMMIEGTVEVAGTVQVDNQRRIENLRRLAEQAKESGDSKTAAQYYGQLLLETPDDWAANFYSIYYDAHNVKIAQIGEAATRVRKCLDNVFRLIVKERNEKNEKADNAGKTVAILKAETAKLDVHTKVMDFSTTLIDNIANHMGDTEKSKSNAVEDWMIPTLFMLIELGDCEIKYFDDYDTAKKAYSYAESCITLVTRFGGTTRQFLKLAKDRLAKVEKEKRRQQEESTKRYWAEHAEERAALETEKTSLQEQISALESTLKAEKKSIRAEAETCRERIRQLSSQHIGLGIFQGKEKRALREQIHTAENELRAIQAKEDKATSEIQIKINPLQNRIKKIDEELTKSR